MPSAPALPAQIRDLVADALYPTSAYQLPSVCERFGLGTGTVSEAFKSKRNYVLFRVNRFPLEKLLEIGRDIVTEHPHYELEEAIAKADEIGCRTLSEPIRRRIIGKLNQISLSGRVELFEFIGELWPVSRMQSRLYEGNTLEDDIHQHMGRNDDWLNEIFWDILGRTVAHSVDFLPFSRRSCIRGRGVSQSSTRS